MNKETSATPETQTPHIESPTRESAMSGDEEQQATKIDTLARVLCDAFVATMSPVLEEEEKDL